MSDKQLFRDLFPNAKPIVSFCHDCEWEWKDGPNIKQARSAVNQHTKTTGHTVAFWEMINLRPAHNTTKPQTRNQLSLF